MTFSCSEGNINLPRWRFSLDRQQDNYQNPTHNPTRPKKLPLTRGLPPHPLATLETRTSLRPRQKTQLQKTTTHQSLHRRNTKSRRRNMEIPHPPPPPHQTKHRQRHKKTPNTTKKIPNNPQHINHLTYDSTTIPFPMMLTKSIPTCTKAIYTSLHQLIIREEVASSLCLPKLRKNTLLQRVWTEPLLP